jgi:glycolate oxidase subunit GlcD
MSQTLSPRLASRLAGLLGPGGVLMAPHELALYAYDGVIETAPPACVVLPETTAQVAEVVRLAAEAGLPVVPRGGGTSLSGGPAPVAGGIVVSLTRMDRILEIDLPNQRAVVQPGVVNLDLLAALEPRGFLFAPDPSSQSVCTLGGNVGENSGGPHCLKYGVTTNHITGLEMVLPDGRVLRTGGKPVGWPGYDFSGAVVGSEGTFGIVTEITCRILPLPQAVTTMLSVFDSLDDASRTVAGIIAAGLLPATLEMMDRSMIEAVQRAMDAGYPEDAEAVLIIELDGLRAGMDRQVASVRDVCERNGARSFQWAEDPAERARLWKGRKGAFAAAANIAPGRLCTDVAVPRSELPVVLAEVMAIGARHGLRVGNVFHAGDGNLHPQVLYDPRDPEQVAHVKAVDEAITRLAIAHGGVLTGEHGIGACKRKWMPLMFSAADLRALQALKDTFDPAGLMNPGKVLPDRDASLDGGAQPLPVSPEPTADALAVDAANLTVTAGAGVTWRELQAAVMAHGQRVPLTPPRPDQATVGSVVASDASGPARLRFGTARDLVTGLRMVLPNGDVVRLGSRCVKNTSGYPLEKLVIGSQGSLATVTEVTFRTVPLPEATLTLCFALRPTEGPADASPRAFCAAAVGGELLPAAVEVLSPALAADVAEGAEGWRVAVALEGLTEEVAALTTAFEDLAGGYGLGAPQRVEGDAQETFWARVTEVGQPTLQATAVLSEALPLGAGLADRLGETVRLRVGPGTGLVLVRAEATGDAATRLAADTHDLARARGGSARWLAPLPDGAVNPPLDPLTDELCRRLKAAYDPGGILPALA